MAELFRPLEVRTITLRNRIVVSPMCQYSSEDGFASDWHLVHLGSRAVGGAALVFTEAAAISPEGRISPTDLGIWKDQHIALLKRITDFLSAQGAVPGMQLAHAGRKASTGAPWLGGKPLAPPEGGWSPILAPSAVAFAAGYQQPKEMTGADIRKVISDFGAAAKRAAAAGFRIIELHAAHGYLIHEFLSPLANRRNDGYGGSFENRTRFACEAVEAIRAAWPAENPLFLRISATDWVEGGWAPSDSVELVKRLKPLGVDVIDCSSGGMVPAAKIPLGAGYQVEFAAQIRREAHIPTCAVGMITSAAQAETIVRSGQADLVVMAREFLRQPYWPLQAAAQLHEYDVAWPRQYERAKL